MALDIIKVCGITIADDACFAAENGATALGFVFFKGSPRYVPGETAAAISEIIPKEVLRVGVFVNESTDQVRKITRVVKLDIVQLHGDETPEYCNALKDLRIWKAFRVQEFFDSDVMTSYNCEAYLLDADVPVGSYGGSGHTFPWQVARDARKKGSIVVSGGLDGDNVISAVKEVHPWGVDASSKLERSPGVKDPQKVFHYLEAAKAAAKIQ